MALTAPAMTAAILAAGPELKGQDFVRVSAAISTAVVAWAVVPANLALSGVTLGVLGAGVVNGKLSVAPQPLPVIGAATASGLVGFMSPSFTRAVGLGIASTFSASGQYQGSSVGVGFGSDLSKVTVSNTATLISGLQAALNSTGIVGFDVPQVSVALGTGISALLLTGVGAGVVTGPVGPSPAGGTSPLSRVF